MKFLAHRGLWHRPEERNRTDALDAALAAGFGIETDVRDAQGSLVIAHDPVTTSAQPLVSLLDAFMRMSDRPTLAINIKADGLSGLLADLLASRTALDYFCFDMSVPESLVYRQRRLRFFTRESEHETRPALYDDAAGVWLDMFHSDWATPEHIRRHLARGKSVALVSPELHKREHLAFWDALREAGLGGESNLYLCTDFPVAAREFFHE